ncbi:CGCGG family rSAM-modified RiPP protein [Natronosalvus halobius]|uniref:CGCGG family putative rSAM-modified RiPP protein n=1 Tax=Natronosalvus halobius TaxID=2953746 RepID=UPI0020A16420|nr:CGCGG family rSAM-modified RiPP protein [Natronosalvus halobius]USZ72398.1 CGCGG family rSAM-modified RiPP protein [Natronosalvus halobius]
MTTASGNDHGHQDGPGADHDHDAEPITDRVHDNSWSANLEKPAHGEDADLVRRQALEAVEHTTSGHHVNLVTHGAHGHPESYLYETLETRLDGDVDWEYVEQCGCGGHVTRVHVR